MLQCLIEILAPDLPVGKHKNNIMSKNNSGVKGQDAGNTKNKGESQQKGAQSVDKNNKGKHKKMSRMVLIITLQKNNPIVSKELGNCSNSVVPQYGGLHK